MSHKEALTEQIFTLIDMLYEKGMETIVTSPGSRSTPLALAAELHPKIRTFIHPDERSAAFFALGLGKRNQSPVGMICTSGTAAANYTPAIAEAGLSHIPLVVLTSDRPAELRDVGAPQAILQNNMYQNYVRYFTELPVAESGQSQTFILDNKVRRATQFFTGLARGPVHFNVPIREPLMPDMTRTDLFTRSLSRPVQKTVPDNIESIFGDILVFLGYTDETLEDIDVLNYKNVTVVADPRQHYRLKHKTTISSHDLIFLSLSDAQKSYLAQHFDYIVRVGEPVTSKATNQFLKETAIPQIVVSEYQDIKTFPTEPACAYVGAVSDVLSRLIQSSAEGAGHQWLKMIDAHVSDMLTKEVEQYTDEGRFTYELLNHLDSSGALFLSSSMPIRDYERYDTVKKHHVYANRGANGIDGVVSTALGMAVDGKVTLVIGDVALYHDMNGLIMAKLEQLDVTVIVFNNNGGGIFSFLPQYEHQEHFERLFGTPLDLDFEHTAALYGFKHIKVEDINDLSNDIVNQSGRHLIEVVTDRIDNLASHQALKNDIAERVKRLG